MNDSDKLFPLLRSVFLFEGMTDEALGAILSDKGCRHAVFSCGETVYGADGPRCLGCLVRGSVTVYQIKGGRRMVLRAMAAGDLFGAASLFGNGEPYESELVADSETEAVFFSAELVTRMLSDPAVSRRYITFLSDRIRFLNARIATFTESSPARRLMRYLSSLETDQGGFLITDCSRKALSDRLDISRATLYRAIDELTSSGEIEQRPDGRIRLCRMAEK